MDCPTEQSWSVYVDREIEPEKSRQFRSHLDQCEHCRDLAARLAAEGRMLVHWLQEVDLEESTDTASESEDAWGSLVRLGTAVLAAATVFRICFDWLFGSKAPPVLGWLDPFSLVGQLNISASAIILAITKGDSMMTTMTGSTSSALLGILLLAALVCVRRMPVWTSALPVALLLAAFVPPCQALDLRDDEPILIVADGETIDDSVIFLGESITVNGTVTGDLIAVGRQVSVRGSVLGSVFSAAQNVDVAGHVGGNLYGFAQSIKVSDGGEVGGNLLAGAQDVFIGGAVGRDLTAGANSLDVAGALGRNLSFGGSVLTIQTPAHIGGDLKAYLEDEDNLRVAAGASIQGTTSLETPEPEPSRFATTGFYVKAFIRFVMALIAGLVLFWLFPPARRIRLGDGRALLSAGGLGFVVAVATPLVAVVTGITLVGLPLALTAVAAWLLGLYLAKIVVAQFIGHMVVASGSIKTGGAVVQLAIGLIVVFLAISLPYIGAVVNILLTLLGFGALLMRAYKSWLGQSALEPQGT